MTPIPMKNFLYTLLSTIVLIMAMQPSSALAADYGKENTPVNLTVGFPCCYAETWSGYVVKEKKLWEKYLPKGSNVSYNIPIAGPPIVNGMLADKIDIGYLGDTAAIALTTKNQIADVRLVATTAISQDQCAILLVRPDAPSFDTPEKAVSWLEGKKIGVPKGSCADRFASEIIKRNNVHPESVLNQTIEVISSNFRAKKLDAAVVWETVASQLINQGLAKRVASGVNFGITDGAFLAMQYELIKNRPDIVHGWLEAEMDAQLFMSDQKNAEEVVEIIHKNVPEFSKDELRNAIYKRYPNDQGGTDVRVVQPFSFPGNVKSLLADETAFLYSIKAISVPKMRNDAVFSSTSDSILKERKLVAPIGQIKASVK